MLSDYIERKPSHCSMGTIFNFRFGLKIHTVKKICDACTIDRGYEYDDEWWFCDIKDMTIYGRQRLVYSADDTNKKLNIHSYYLLSKLQRGGLKRYVRK